MKKQKHSKIISIFSSFRPAQWTKNLSIFAALIISGKLFEPTLFTKAFFTFVAFSFLSSSSYLVNDIVDYDKDKLHPSKKKPTPFLR